MLPGQSKRIASLSCVQKVNSAGIDVGDCHARFGVRITSFGISFGLQQAACLKERYLRDRSAHCEYRAAGTRCVSLSGDHQCAVPRSKFFRDKPNLTAPLRSVSEPFSSKPGNLLSRDVELHRGRGHGETTPNLLSGDSFGSASATSVFVSWSYAEPSTERPQDSRLTTK